MSPLHLAPRRQPWGALVGALVGVSLWIGTMIFCQRQWPTLPVQYLTSYMTSAVIHKPLSSYRLFSFPDGHLASQKDLDDRVPGIARRSYRVNPQRLHVWLRKSVYHDRPAYASFRFPMISLAGFFFVFAGLGLWSDVHQRNRAMKGYHIRGTRMVSLRQFKKEVPQTGLRFKIGRKWRWFGRVETVAIPKELECYQIQIVGTMGSGKTTLIRQMLHQYRERGTPFVVYDPKREYRAEFYRPGVDYIIDPTDNDCVYWAMECEAESEAEGTAWAVAFWPDNPRENSFFLTHPRNLYAFLIARFSAYQVGDPKDLVTCANLGKWLANPDKEIAKRIKGTTHAVTFNPKAIDQSAGLQGNMNLIAQSLRMMPEIKEGRRVFSVKQWARNPDGCIFLTSTPETLKALLPLQSAMLDVLILKNQEAVIGDRNVSRPPTAIILDELGSLEQLPQLESGATKQRASGNTIVDGLQGLSQLRKNYGHDSAETIASQAYTNFFLRIKEPDAASHASRMIGEHEIARWTRTAPAGTGHRGGHTWNPTQLMTPVVMPAELAGLKRFRGYLSFEDKCLPIRIQNIPRKIIAPPVVERIIPTVIYKPEPEVQDPPPPAPEEAGDMWAGTQLEPEGEAVPATELADKPPEQPKTVTMDQMSQLMADLAVANSETKVHDKGKKPTKRSARSKSVKEDSDDDGSTSGRTAGGSDGSGAQAVLEGMR